MIGTAIRAKLAPYLLWIVLAAIASAFAFGCYQGNKHGVAVTKVANQKAVDKLNKTIAEKKASLRNAAEALRAAAGALDAINREAARRRAEALAAERAAESAKAFADAYAKRLQRDRALYEQALADARKAPSCAALLDFDVGAELRKAGCPALLNGGAK